MQDFEEDVKKFHENPDAADDDDDEKDTTKDQDDMGDDNDDDESSAIPDPKSAFRKKSKSTTPGDDDDDEDSDDSMDWGSDSDESSSSSDNDAPGMSLADKFKKKAFQISSGFKKEGDNDARKDRKDEKDKKSQKKIKSSRRWEFFFVAEILFCEVRTIGVIFWWEVQNRFQTWSGGIFYENHILKT